MILFKKFLKFRWCSCTRLLTLGSALEYYIGQPDPNQSSPSPTKRTMQKFFFYGIQIIKNMNQI